MSAQIVQTFILTPSDTSEVVLGEAVWQSGVSPHSGGKRFVGEPSFGVRVSRADGSDVNATWAGKVSISSIYGDLEVAEDDIGSGIDDSTGPIGTYSVQIYRALNYRLTLVPATADPASLQIRIEVFA